jgi:antitoxin ParD1/3/4
MAKMAPFSAIASAKERPTGRFRSRNARKIFVESVVRDGRCGSANEVVEEGLRLVEEREAKLLAPRAAHAASIAQGGEVTEKELDVGLAAGIAELRSRGYVACGAQPF